MSRKPTPAETLSGRTLRTGWIVGRRFEPGEDATGGNFSTCYEVEREDRRAFLKAIDIHGVLWRAPDQVMEVMQHVAAAYNHEARLLEVCGVQRMDRVVRALDRGEEVIDPEDPFSIVFYFVFELASGDIRAVHDLDSGVDVATTLRTLHDVATAIKQLHGAQIAHQDVKPSNVLVFEERVRNVSRVADLGRASTPAANMDHDTEPGAGDPAYWTPESAYRGSPPTWHGRRACDLYHLGSLMLFLFTGVSTTPALISRLQADYVPEIFDGPYAGSFEDALPHLRNALQQVCDAFPDVGDPQLRERLIGCLRQLCEPDPDLRGHPKNRRGSADRYSVERFVAFFDLEARRASSSAIRRAA